MNERDKVIFSAGTKLSEVPPDFRGISVEEWRRRRFVANLEAAHKFASKVDVAETSAEQESRVAAG